MGKNGFTLIELLIVVAIIGIVAAIAIPNLLVALQKSKQKATMGDLKSIGTAIESYITDWTVAPISSPIAQLWFEPYYIKVCPRVDGWGHGWGYEDTVSDEYSIWSGGRGGAIAPAAGNLSSDGLYICTKVADFDNDICFSNGYFSVGPEVKR